MLLNSLTYHAPRTTAEAAKLYSELPEVKILAGGTFLLNSLELLKKKGTRTPLNILSLRKIADLKGVFSDNKTLTIRAMTHINDLFDSSHLTDNFALLRTVCRNISTHPIRNMATVGGNLTCRYTWTEMGAVMIALDAVMHFIDAQGAETTLGAEDFFKNAAKSDKIFTHVTIARDKAASIAYRRVKKSLHVDIPLLAVCVKTNFKGKQFTNTRVTVNNGINFAQRDYKLENFLNQSQCHPDLPQQALDHLEAAIYDTRSIDYKKYMFRASLKSAIKELVERSLRK